MADPPEDARWVRVHVTAEPDAEETRAADLTWDLSEELLQLDVDSVDRIEGKRMSGAKGTFFEWAELAVTVSGGLPSLVAYLRGWVGRHDQCELTLELDGDRLTLKNASAETQTRLIQEWLAAVEKGASG